MADHILSELRADGLTLTAVDGRLVVEPAVRITDEHRALIRAHKAGLLELLQRGGTPRAGECGTCGTCRHMSRPGLSEGYCGGDRPDLQPAYGLHHPLRRLPADHGVTCRRWGPQ